MLNDFKPLKLEIISGAEGGRMRGVAVRFMVITQNSDCDGSIP